MADGCGQCARGRVGRERQLERPMGNQSHYGVCEGKTLACCLLISTHYGVNEGRTLACCLLMPLLPTFDTPALPHCALTGPSIGLP